MLYIPLTVAIYVYMHIYVYIHRYGSIVIKEEIKSWEEETKGGVGREKGEAEVIQMQ